MGRKALYDDDIMGFIEFHWFSYYTPPTLRYLCDLLHINSTCVVAGAYRRLEKAGKVKVVKGKPVPKVVQIAIIKAYT
jgi:hypothetical protein